MNDLTITLIQTNLFWEESARNLKHFDHLIGRITTPSDLILLPEMFNTGFSINPQKCAEEMNGTSMEFLKVKSKEKEAVILATLLIEENKSYYNRLVAVYPDGRVLHYDKRHLFRLSEEYKIIRGGKAPLIIEVKGWKIKPLTCYDLRFPVWSKNTYDKGVYGYDLLVYLANWPSNRAYVWKSLLTARAIENQAYVAGLNRVGDDGFGTFHSGDSVVIDAKGQPLKEATPSQEEIITATLPASDLNLFRESFTLGLDWDRFTIHS
jgi:predicted amidohydrolase